MAGNRQQRIITRVFVRKHYASLGKSGARDHEDSYGKFWGGCANCKEGMLFVTSLLTLAIVRREKPSRLSALSRFQSTHAFLSVILMTTKLATVGPARRREAADQPSLDLCAPYGLVVNSVPTRQPGLHIDLRFIGEDIFGTDNPTTSRTYNISSNGMGAWTQPFCKPRVTPLHIEEVVELKANKVKVSLRCHCQLS